MRSIAALEHGLLRIRLSFERFDYNGDDDDDDEGDDDNVDDDESTFDLNSSTNNIAMPQMITAVSRWMCRPATPINRLRS
jgi:hypothetical protein